VLHLLVLGLSPKSIFHLYFSQLLYRHGWHIVAWSEHLVLVLIPQSNSLIDGVRMDVCFLFWVLILIHDIQSTAIIYILRPHQVWNFIHAVFCDCFHLKRRKSSWLWLGTLSLIGLYLLRRQLSLMLEDVQFHINHPELLEGDEHRPVDH